MGSESAVVQIARREICRAMRSRSPDVRACMPFDPGDARDVEVWIAWRLRQHAWAGDESVSYMVQWIRWQATKACRRKPIAIGSLFDDSGSHGVNCECELEGRRSSLEAELASEVDVSEELIACVIAAIGRAFVINELHTQRTAIAVLSCVARIVTTVSTVLSPPLLQGFKERIVCHPLLAKLSLPLEIRERFKVAMAQLQSSGNTRQDLRAVGWSSPGNRQWAAFKHALATEW